MNGVIKIPKAVIVTILQRYNMNILYVVTHGSPIILSELVKFSCKESRTSHIYTEINMYLEEVMQNFKIKQDKVLNNKIVF